LSTLRRVIHPVAPARSYSKKKHITNTLRKYGVRVTPAPVTLDKKNIIKNLAVGYAVVFGIAGLWFYMDYKKYPLRSSVDRVIRWWAGPYRDYIMATPQESEVVGDTYKCLNPEFEIKFPTDKFVRPGLILRDNLGVNGENGSLELEDDFGNYMVIDWLKLDTLEVDLMKKDPVAVLTNNYERFKKGVIATSQERQREDHKEFVDVSEKLSTSGKIPEGLADSCPPYIFAAFVEDEYYRQANLHIYEHHNVPPNNNMWNGSVLFINKGYLFAITSTYPNNMINFAVIRENMLKKGASEDDVRKKLSVDTSEKLHPRLKEMEDKSTSSRSKIIDTLRVECTSLLSNNFSRFEETNKPESDAAEQAESQPQIAKV